MHLQVYNTVNVSKALMFQNTKPRIKSINLQTVANLRSKGTPNLLHMN